MALIEEILRRLGRPGGPFAIPGESRYPMDERLPEPIPNESTGVYGYPRLEEPRASATTAPPIVEPPAFEGPQQPTTLQNMLGQYNREYVNPPKRSLKDVLLEGIRQFAPVAIGGLVGGEAGALGASQGVQQVNQQQAALREQRRREFVQGIEAQRGREERMAERELAAQTAANQLKQQAEQFGVTEKRLGDAQKFAQSQPTIVPQGSAAIRRGETTPFFTNPKEPTTSTTPHTVQTAEGVFQYNPATERYDIRVGAAKPGTETPHTVNTTEGVMLWNPVTQKYDTRVGGTPAMFSAPSLVDLRTAQAGQIKEAQETKERYTKERANRTINAVDEILPLVNNTTAGAGSLLGNLPLTGARTLRAKLDTLKANITQNELAQMRQTSRGGGALGSVSDREGTLLANSLGAIDQGMDPADLKKELTNIKGIVQRYQEAVEKAGAAEAPPKPAPKPNTPSTGGNKRVKYDAQGNRQ